MKWFRDPQEWEADRQLYAQSELMLSEEDMELFLTALKGEKAFQSEQRTRVLAYLKFFENGEAGFRHRKLKEMANDLVAALQELKAHTAAHFLAFPRNQTGPDYRYFLHPDYFILEMTDISIEEHQFYLKTEQDLARMVDRVAAAYRKFRAAARKRLED